MDNLEQTPTDIRLTQIASDLDLLLKSLSDLMKIAEAARTVVWQRYNTDPNNTFGKEFPDVSKAIFALANLVGLPSTDASGTGFAQGNLGWFPSREETVDIEDL